MDRSIRSLLDRSTAKRMLKGSITIGQEWARVFHQTEYSHDLQMNSRRVDEEELEVD